MGLWQLEFEGSCRLARGDPEDGPREVLREEVGLDEVVRAGADALQAVLASASDGPVPPGARVTAPVGQQEVWAAGVTYGRSRDARVEESGVPDSYDLVYAAPRPELFMKAAPGRVRGPGETVGVRADSGWDVPEPELALIADPRGELIAYTLGNDVSSRRIEGENPLYLPQAKMYRHSCALGPCLVPVDRAPERRDLRISLEVHREGQVCYADRVDVADMRRTPEELLEWLYRAQDYPNGVVLLTGTAIVPDDEFTLRPGDEVVVRVPGLGELRNAVERVGRSA
ncbi:fumarylacetoacetate hydrolase [Egibacter rhizosphaerae]|uniref:Fumarylacetoacetate hydrolase n=1 Tax=Egibacter rhizosphaerae TaxID=1670831 RepID=A0A411YJP6_9ACTN|nr:fumarylacetoacetate hydrolase family protein [Egibacter rhizosphaerae]QBI21420.1 fumarylacetoacetate hydrolase [Egibacter rhizosphaerae]